MKHKVFVYGTLKKGNTNHCVIEGSTAHGEAETVENMGLYDLGPYPFAMRGQHYKSTIKGELYEVNQTTLKRLDKLEGYPRLYTRQKVDVRQQKTVHKAWIYLLNRQNPPRALIVEDGDWIEPEGIDYE